ncbi:kinase-like domain-containing protein [Umbelopsis sp. PMI_123]|nr:kinase-like domain-containing protein [Umbelopsis sp. PMI_123]
MISVEPIPSRSHSQSQYSPRYSNKPPTSVNKQNTSQTMNQRTGRRHSTISVSSTRSVSRERPKKYVGDYYLGRTLGKGASGRVKLGIHRVTGEYVAVKIINKAYLSANPAIDKAVKREIAIMKLIHHPSIMALHDVIEDDESPELYLILEYMEGGELFEYLVSEGRLPESKARSYFQQIIFGVDYCHRHLICHRDLKPENLLLDRNLDIKIADFGMASLQPVGSLLETSCGSPHYASPEIVTGRPYDGSSSDIWSCGIILYALLTGHLPFDDENIRLLLKKVKTGRYVMPHDISYEAQDLIRKILVTDPSKRITVYQTEEIKRHPWFAQDIPPKIAQLPEPPSAQEIDRPISDISQVDDRIVETIKFLWGETKTEAVLDALMAKEHNMQKVTYVLLQRHAEKYWESRHDEDEDAAQHSSVHPTELPPSPMPSPRIRSKSSTARGDLGYSRLDSDINGSRRNSTKEGYVYVSTFIDQVMEHTATGTEKPTSEQRKRLHRLSMPVLDIGSIGIDRKSINFSLRRKDISSWKEAASPTSSMMSPPMSPSPPASPAPARSKSGRNTHLTSDMFFPSVPPTPKPSTGTGYSTPPSSHGSSNNEIAFNQPNSQSQPTADTKSNKIPWLQNLFFFKQPKIFSVSCEAVDCHQALRKIQDAMRDQGMDAKLQTRLDRDGHTRYRGEVRILHSKHN